MEEEGDSISSGGFFSFSLSLSLCLLIVTMAFVYDYRPHSASQQPLGEYNEVHSPVGRQIRLVQKTDEQVVTANARPDCCAVAFGCNNTFLKTHVGRCDVLPLDVSLYETTVDNKPCNISPYTVVLETETSAQHYNATSTATSLVQTPSRIQNPRMTYGRALALVAIQEHHRGRNRGSEQTSDDSFIAELFLKILTCVCQGTKLEDQNKKLDPAIKTIIDMFESLKDKSLSLLDRAILLAWDIPQSINHKTEWNSVLTDQNKTKEYPHNKLFLKLYGLAKAHHKECRAMQYENTVTPEETPRQQTDDQIALAKWSKIGIEHQSEKGPKHQESIASAEELVGTLLWNSLLLLYDAPKMYLAVSLFLNVPSKWKLDSFLAPNAILEGTNLTLHMARDVALYEASNVFSDAMCKKEFYILPGHPGRVGAAAIHGSEKNLNQKEGKAALFKTELFQELYYKIEQQSSTFEVTDQSLN